MQARNAFTLIELLVVIAIIGILAALIFPVFRYAIAQSRKTSCMSNLKQQGAAFIMYRDDNEQLMPPWLSHLYPNYSGGKELYICPQDETAGRDGARHGYGLPGNQQFWQLPSGGGGHPSEIDELNGPDEIPIISSDLPDMFAYLDDTARNNDSRRRYWGANLDIEASSYEYSFTNIFCTWQPPKTWWEIKYEQLNEGYGRDVDGDGDYANNWPSDPDQWSAESWPPEAFPTVRCFHHFGKIIGNAQLTLNTGFAGNVFDSETFMWEEDADY